MDYAPFTMRQMVEAGMHFGHTTRRCNPKMLPWIFGQRNGVHIIDLEQSQQLLRQALVVMHDATANGRKILIVGTKRQAQTIVADTAKSCGQFYINRRWLGGTLTNWQTVSKSVDALKMLDEKLEKNDELEGLTKREKLSLTRKRDKLERALGGIREMSELPDLMLVIDTNKEATAIKEAQNLNIPIVAFLDSNSNPDGITYPVPANDDATRALKFYLNLVAQAVINGLEQSLARAGKKPDKEPLLEAEMARKASADSEKGKSASAKDKNQDKRHDKRHDKNQDKRHDKNQDKRHDKRHDKNQQRAQNSDAKQKEIASSGKAFTVKSKVKVIAKDKADGAEGKTENKTENKAENKTENKAENKTENKTENKVENKTENKVENKTENKVENKSGEKDAAPEQAEKAQKQEVKPAVEVSTRKKIVTLFKGEK